MRILLVAGSPAPSSSALVSHLAAQNDLVLAVDRGADACRAAGVVPGAFCGDADTVSEEGLAWVRDQALRRGDGDEMPIRLFPPAKDDTDLSLGFTCARELAAERGEGLKVAVTCASAGRMDHALAVFGVLAKNADLAPRLIEDEFECRILAPSGTETWALGEGALGSRFSFVALADDTCVSETGLRWELDHFHVDALRDRGISNVVDAADARVTCHEGILAAFLIN
ncbi:thiamine diphosphokinase [uncultured Parolsenella sp.]|uniref:thiamine diphosphokinase n=1 Tax=uncultured Parolsenella sp. TaxID=2083008 RepID=UPI0025DF7CAA|nr:thiamine diphosphokinase [uncultured Parolsenella sp.]